MSDVKVDLKYLVEDPDRHGNLRIYARRFRRKIRLREKLGTEEFLQEYKDAVDKLSIAASAPVPALVVVKRNTLGWLAARYYDSDEFKNLDEQSQATRRGVIDSCLEEPRRPDKPKALMRDCPLSILASKHIKMLRDRKKGLPGAANNRKKYLSSMFSWAIENDEGLASNPCRDVKPKKYVKKGFHTWTIEEVGQYVKRHPIGTKACLTLGLLLFLGTRPSDMLKLGRQMVKGNQIGFVPKKTDYLRDEMSYKPILPVLQKIIDASPCGDLTFLETEYGLPFSPKGFGGKMRDWCDQANLHHCTAHGLRKAGATIAADMGASVHTLMAMFDWTTTKQAEAYTRAADRKRLAKVGLPMIAAGMIGEHEVSHLLIPECPTAVKSNT